MTTFSARQDPDPGPGMPGDPRPSQLVTTSADPSGPRAGDREGGRRAGDRQRPVTRAVLLALALIGLITGAWAAIAPESFYADFPGFRSAWVSVDGPFNEHLLRDVGAFFLALGVLAAAAAISGRLVTARLAGAAWLVFSAVHAAYHLSHLHVYAEPVDQWLNAASMVGSIALALAALVIPGARDDRGRSGS